MSKYKKSKKLLKILKKGDAKGNKKDGGVRATKQVTIRQMKGHVTPVKNWDNEVAKNMDKFIAEVQKGYEVDDEMVGVLTSSILKRVGIYQKVAELTGVPLTRGEATWAIQYEYIFQRQLLGQNMEEEASRRDVQVHNIKYIIEQVYNRYGYGDFEEVKQGEYDTVDVSRIPSTNDKKELEGIYLTLLEEAYEKLESLVEISKQEEGMVAGE